MRPSSNAQANSPASIYRRNLLKAGGIGLLNLGIPGMVAARVDANPTRSTGAAKKSCIFHL